MARLVRKDDRPGLLRRLAEERRLDLDRGQRKVVERRHPARVGAPRAHAQVTEEANRPTLPAYDDCLVTPRMAAGAHDRHAGHDLLVALAPPTPPPHFDQAQVVLLVPGLQAWV